MLWSLSVLQSIHEATKLRPPQQFVSAINTYHDPQRLIDLGLILDTERTSDSSWDAATPFNGDKFLPFLESNSNWFLVGCGEKLTGVIAAAGILFTDKRGGFTHANVDGFLHMLDRTKGQGDGDLFEIFAEISEYDLIDDPKIMSEVDEAIEAKLQTGLEWVPYYLTAASEAMAIRLLKSDDFMIQEAAADRLGELESRPAIGPLTRLASLKVEKGRVHQHVEAARLALKRIQQE